MNVLDSSGWLEYFADGPNADAFASVAEKPEELLVPTVSVYEVFKKVLSEREEGDALRAVAFMQQGKVVDLDSRIALEAARLAVTERIPMADSIMLASARMYDAILWTQDADFEGMGGVRYIRKGS